MKKYGLVGHPLGHSFSKSFFERLFVQLGWDGQCEYLNFDLPHRQQVRELVESQSIRGLSVTIPYKRDVLEFVDRLTPEARAVGAVNCIEFRDGVSIGHNTDVIGFRDSLVEFLDGQRVERALILGTGGAALAVRYALEELDIQCSFVSRSQTNAAGYGYGQLDSTIMQAHKLIVNTTPLGMWPNTDSAPEIPFEELTDNHYLYDLVYNPEVTRFMAQGASQGARVMGGLRMLHLQALASWEIWNK